MVVFNSKRILFLFSCICISIFSFFISNTNNQTISTSSTPISTSVVIIDAGHGYPDEGASSTDGTTEANINLSIALKLQELIEASGCSSILTRSDENGIYDSNKNSIKEKKVSDLKNRVNLINESKSNLLVSIHLNKFEDSKYSGWQTFYRKNDDLSKNLAVSIQNNLNLAIQKENKREALSISDKYIIDNTQIPATIIECGFLSNEEEASLLKTEEYQEKIAWGIYTGIMDYMNSEY